MKILLRNQSQGPWELVESAGYGNENELQNLLAESPGLISLSDVRPDAGTLIAAVREVPLSVGWADLLAFSAEGDFVIIECKLARNVQIRREVIGQVLEYGAHLWGMKYEDLDASIRLRSGCSLADLVRSKLENEQREQNWDEEGFRRNVQVALQDGSFILMIVVDEINGELSRIVEFLNTCGQSSFALAALEMRRFQNGSVEMLVPRVFGDIHSQPGSSRTRKTWNEITLLEDAEQRLDKKTFSLIKDLYKWTKSMCTPGFGTGPVNGSFSFYYNRDGKQGNVFSVYSDGGMTINFGYMEKIFSPEEIAKFKENLRVLHPFRDVISRNAYYHNVKIQDAFADPETLIQFKQIVQNLKTW